MRAYQCSRCKKLYDGDECCACMADIDPRPHHRERGDAEKCRENFELIEEQKEWHVKFPWEK